MSLIAVIGAGIQLILLLVTKWFQMGDFKKEERKSLYEDGKKALADRDASRLSAAITGMRNL